MEVPMNKVMLIGNISNDLEIKKTQTGKSLLAFSVAVNEGFGEKKTTDFIKCRAWEKTADLIAQYCHKGSKIFVEGKYKTESYEKNGQKVYSDYVLVSSIEFLDSKETRQTISTNPQWNMSTQTTQVKLEEDALPFY